MDKKKENTLLAFTEWLDKETDAYMVLATKEGKTTLIMSGDSDELSSSLTTGVVKYPEVASIVFDTANQVLNMPGYDPKNVN